VTRFARALHVVACAASLVALIFLCLAWKLWLAPLRPGGSWLVLKALPLLVPLLGVLRGRRYTLQLAALLVLVYLFEGLVRVASDTGMAATLAVTETGLALVFYTAATGYLRFSAGRSTG
jgi:uncharacterized membrane protein